MDSLRNLSRSVRVWVLIIALLISAVLLTNITGVNKDKGIGIGNGLVYGLDFAGGTEIWLKLENPTSPENMTIERGILENRLNTMGLKDIPVTVYGDQHIIVKIAKASPEDIKAIEDILKQQANFEQRIDGVIAVKGEEITVDSSSRGSVTYPTKGGYGWSISLRLNQEGAARFGKAAQGKFFGVDNPRNRPVDIFIDRPEKTTILVTDKFYGVLGNATTSGTTSDDIYYGDNAIKVIENRSDIPMIILYPNDLDRTLAQIKEYAAKGYTKTIIAEDDSKINDTVRNMVEEQGVSIQRIPQGNMTVEEWIKAATGLKTSPKLNFDTRGEPIYGAQITGGATTMKAAEDELEQNQVWLSSGNLPEKAVIESKSTIPASLGAQFLRYSLITGFIGVLCVALIIFLRYRKMFIVIPTLITGVSEIIIILGLAVLIKWEIDLPAIAGIIAALGTGVDNQIVITDETIQSRASTEKKSINVADRIKRAFFIIFTSAATIVAIMLPLMTFVAGTLKGFALITIMGVLIGIFITRPAYARIIEEFMKTE